MELSIGKLRGLQQCTSRKGTLTCLALDHRQNLRKANPLFEDDAELSQFKLDVTAQLADLATAVLLDPEVSAAQAVAAGALPGWVGLVVALEATGYGGAPTARESRLLPGWSVEKAKRMGAGMVKLLVYYHPDSPTAPEIEDFVRGVVAACQQHDLGLMLEPLSYSLVPDTKLTSAEKRFVITETARRLVIPGVDVFKAEFPLDITQDPQEAKWAEACAQITAASRAPWIVLSAAVDFESYLRQVQVACRAGASGCAVGRAVWQEAVSLERTARLDFLRSTGRTRLAALSAVCSELGKPVQKYYTATVPFDWYRKY
jgi:tagatose 1,6-diphosphate aldolase